MNGPEAELVNPSRGKDFSGKNVSPVNDNLFIIYSFYTFKTKECDKKMLLFVRYLIILYLLVL